MPHLSASRQQCIDECQNCQAVCLQTVEHCLTKGGKHANHPTSEPCWTARRYARRQPTSCFAARNFMPKCAEPVRKCVRLARRAATGWRTRIS